MRILQVDRSINDRSEPSGWLDDGIAGLWAVGAPSLFARPQCHGVLLSKEGSNLRFRGHTGHAYSLETLLADFNDKNERALRNAVRAFEETIMLLRRMADNVHAHGHESAGAGMSRQGGGPGTHGPPARWHPGRRRGQTDIAAQV